MADVQEISVGRLGEMQKQGEVDLIDVRTPAEYGEVHADGARNVPLDVLNPRQVMESRNGLGEQPLYIICNSGNRSKKAAEKFLDAGFENVVSVDGGTKAWEGAGLPVIRGRKAMSLERQVRIAAGSLVLLGAILGYTVHPYFIGLSAFVGAGLIFAGITDTCGMGMLLARMPWNQRSGCDSGSCQA